MNKKLIALAVAAIAAPAAMAADNEIIMYGQVNVGVELSNFNSGTYAHNPDQVKVSNLASRLGFKGTEDLGDGVKSFFKIESKVAPDDASKAGFATREGWVGLQSSLGQIALGRGKSPYTNASEEFDPWDHDYSSALVNNAPVAYRLSNSVRYNYTANGFTFAAANGVGEDKTATHRESNEFSTFAKYANQQFMVIAAYDTFSPTVGSHTSAVQLGGAVTLGNWWIGLTAQNRNYGTDIPKLDGSGTKKSFNDVQAIVTYTDGAMTWIGEVTKWDKNAPLAANTINGQSDQAGITYVNGTEKTQANLGFQYALSKRTVVSLEYTGNVWGMDRVHATTLGLNHSF
ncbi:MAG: porin [Burkholderiales bacterium]|nr:porin [Burkholderiales bacterium]